MRSLALRISTILGLSSALVILACGAPEPALEEIPDPEGLASMEPQIRHQYERSRETLTALDTQADSSYADRAQAWADLAHWFHAHRLLGPAMAGYRNAARLEPTEPAWQYLQATIALRIDQFEGARHLLLSVIEAEDYVPAIVALAEVEIELGAQNKASLHFNRALELAPGCLRARKGLARLAQERGDLETAIEAFRAILQEAPNATSVHYALGMAARDAGDLELAHHHLDRARIQGNDERVVLPLDDPWMAPVEQLRRRRSTTRLKTAERLFEAGRPGEAKQGLLDLLADDGEDPHVRFLLGLVERRLGDSNAAREQFLLAVKGLPDYPPIHHQLGILAGIASPQAAREHFLRALELDPAFQRARFRLASLERGLGRCETALQHYARILESEPTHATARFGRVVCLLRDGRWKSSLAELELATANHPEASALRHLLARTLATSPVESLRDGHRALDLVRFPAGSRVHFQQIETLAMAYATLGKFSDAARWQEGAVQAIERTGRIDPTASRARLSRYRSSRPTRTVWEHGEPETLSRLLGESVLEPAPLGRSPNAAQGIKQARR